MLGLKLIAKNGEIDPRAPGQTNPRKTEQSDLNSLDSFIQQIRV